MEPQVYDLIVLHDFDGYTKGARITDGAEVARIHAEEKDHHCRRVFASAKPVVVDAAPTKKA